MQILPSNVASAGEAPTLVLAIALVNGGALFIVETFDMTFIHAFRVDTYRHVVMGSINLAVIGVHVQLK